MARDLLTVFCRGEGRRFGGQVCEFLDAPTGQCRLLRDHALNAVFEQGRCAPFEMVTRALAKHLDKYRDVLEPGEHRDAMAFEIAVRLTEKRLNKGFQIYVLQGYINRTVYCSVIEFLRREDPLVKKQCGNCRHLSLARPYICQRVTVITPAHGEEDNRWYDSPRNITDRACQYGFETVETFSADAAPAYSAPVRTTEMNTSGLLLNDMVALLARRAGELDPGRAKRRADRQYVVFAQLLERCGQGETHQEAVSAIADDLAVSVKTIQREISEIRTFFEREGVLDDLL